MAIDRTKDKDRFTHMLKGWIDQFAHSLSSTDTKKHIEMLVIEPFMQFIIKQTFPYMIIAICMFTGIFLFVILTFVMLLINQRKTPQFNVCPFCEKSLKGF
jgi:hypothetical protein